jgi:hypothetical protein
MIDACWVPLRCTQPTRLYNLGRSHYRNIIFPNNIIVGWVERSETQHQQMKINISDLLDMGSEDD